VLDFKIHYVIATVLKSFGMKYLQKQFNEILAQIEHSEEKTYQVWIKQLKRLVRTCEISIIILLIILIAELTLLFMGYIPFSIIALILIPLLIYQIRRIWKLGNFIECHYEFMKCLFGEIDKEGVM
jgi:hypothetical protein